MSITALNLTVITATNDEELTYAAVYDSELGMWQSKFDAVLIDTINYNKIMKNRSSKLTKTYFDVLFVLSKYFCDINPDNFFKIKVIKALASSHSKTKIYFSSFLKKIYFIIVLNNQIWYLKNQKTKQICLNVLFFKK